MSQDKDSDLCLCCCWIRWDELKWVECWTCSQPEYWQLILKLLVFGCCCHKHSNTNALGREIFCVFSMKKLLCCGESKYTHNFSVLGFFLRLKNCGSGPFFLSCLHFTRSINNHVTDMKWCLLFFSSNSLITLFRYDSSSGKVWTGLDWNLLYRLSWSPDGEFYSLWWFIWLFYLWFWRRRPFLSTSEQIV